METISTSGIDWDVYYENARKSLTKTIELEVNWKHWTESDKQFKLITQVMDTTPERYRNGGFPRVHFYCYGDTIEDLENLYSFMDTNHRIDHTIQSFIIDLKEKKVVKILSICA